jgi:hypothetical protein
LFKEDEPVKKVIAASALLSVIATSGFACSVEEKAAISNAISEKVQEVVAMDAANLGTVMSVMNVAAVEEYYAGPLAPQCARQINVLNTLNEMSEVLGSEQAASL